MRKIWIASACALLSLATFSSPAVAGPYSYCKATVTPSLKTVTALITIGDGYGQKRSTKTADAALATATSKARKKFEIALSAANATCTKTAKVATLARKSGLKKAKSSAARLSVRAKYDGILTLAIANRNEAVTTAFAAWLSKVIAANATYNSTTTTQSTAALRARTDLLNRASSARGAYLDSLSRANTQFDRDVNAGSAALTATLGSTRSVSTKARAWETYARQVAAALDRATTLRLGAAPKLQSDISGARTEYDSDIDEIEEEESDEVGRSDLMPDGDEVSLLTTVN